MIIRPRSGRVRKALMLVTVTAAVAAGALVTLDSAGAATSGPCDIYAAGGTPCVAAHSTTRALYTAYTGSLYQGTSDAVFLLKDGAEQVFGDQFRIARPGGTIHRTP